MSNDLSNELKTQMFGQDSSDPFLMLITFNHASLLTPFYFVNDRQDIISNGITYSAFPIKITLPPDDNESNREVSLVLDNIALELIEDLRAITTPLDCTIDMVLTSNPNVIQYTLGDLKLKAVTYNKSTITAKLILDNFLSTELTSEKYDPTHYPGIF